MSAEERQALIDERRARRRTSTRASRSTSRNPQDDLTTFLLDAELDGNKLHPDHVRGTMVLLMIAGIDTTWSAIGASLWHLAQHPDDRKRLAAEPELMDTAVEEFLRAYAPVTMARLVAKDFDFKGCPMKEGDWLLLPFPAANRDPEVFPDADEVLIDRVENRHAAFGLGIHRCLGSNLARMELRVALEEWMKRYPDFELTDPDAGHVVGRPGPRSAHHPGPHRLTRRQPPAKAAMTGAKRSIGPVSSRSGRLTIAVCTPASASARNRPIWSATVPALTAPRSARRSTVAAAAARRSAATSAASRPTSVVDSCVTSTVRGIACRRRRSARAATATLRATTSSSPMMLQASA